MMRTLKRKLQRLDKRYVFIALFGLAGLGALVYVRAATPTASFEAESASRTSNVQVVSDPTASAGQHIQFNAAPTTPPPTSGGACDLPKFPTPNCVGADLSTNFTVRNGDYTITASGTYQNMLVKGKVNICANNVTFKNSIVEGGIESFAINTRDYPCNGELRSGVLVEDVTVRPTNYSFPSSNWAGYDASNTPAVHANWAEISIGPSGYTCRRCELISMDGPRVATALYGSNRSSSNILIEDSYIFVRSDAPGEPCNHTDGVQGYGGGTNVIIRHTTIDAGRPCASGGVFMGDSSPEAEVYDSLILGAGFGLKLNSDPGETMTYKVRGVRIANNTWNYGPTSCQGTGTINFPIWQDVTVVNIDNNYNVTGTVRSIASC